MINRIVVSLPTMTPVSYTHLDVYKRQVHASLQTLPPQPGDMAHTLADINQARALLCWEPQISLEEGIRSFLDWFAQQPDDGDEEE